MKETVFQAEQRETNLMENTVVLNDLNILVQKLLISYAKSTERLVSSEQDHSEDSSREGKLLLALSNCQYTLIYVFPRYILNKKEFYSYWNRICINIFISMFVFRLKDHWKKLGYPDLSTAIQSAKESLEKTDGRLMEAYLEEKVEPLIGIVEPSMYAGRFDWNKTLPTEDVRPYCKEIIMNMIAVHAEVAQVSV